MALTTVNRGRVLAQWMREQTTPLPAVSKADLAAAVAAMDDWLDANVTSLNAAIPQPARAQLSAALKFELVGYILMRRAGRLRAEEDG
ncbi:hypothetical protein GCM10017559_08460 [Streptosporangium longisporum]|uniref:DUF1320 domain-containing protein n=1 Tax=Streptosporangium longisporum TaxID=46187 RepID=A0ABP6K819_9ACTN